MTELLQFCVDKLHLKKLRVGLSKSRLAWVVLAAVLLPTLLDPDLGFRNSVAAQAVNASLPFAVMLLAWGLGGRAWVALGCEVVLLGALRYADQVKLTYLNTGLVYADFAAVPGLLREPRLILGFIHPTAKEMVAIAIALLLAGMAAWWSRRRRSIGPGLRGACLVSAAALLLIIGCVRVPDSVPDLGWSVWTQRIGAKSVGVAGNIVLGRMASHNAVRVADP
ncbi:MAG TPA: hypothetical protein VHA37_00355, partial [Candidatus Saccharimonadales bacterium]|nr:hypothetical protein [Candidatus Saccharimonadales bacterium]